MSDEKLILMQKDGQQLKVHPTTVKAHEMVGWKVVKAESESQAEVVEDKKAHKDKKGADQEE